MDIGVLTTPEHIPPLQKPPTQKLYKIYPLHTNT